VLNFISPHLATSYFLLAFVTTVGALQFVAARHRLVGLTWIGSARKPIWGYLFAIVLIVAAFTWFFVATWEEVFIPGLAGSELAILFGAAGICSLAATLLFSSILHGVQHRERPDLKGNARLHHEAIAWQQLRGTLYQPKDAASLKGEPRAAICVLPSPSERTLSPHPIVANLVNEGFIVLAIDWGPDKEIRYPAILGLLPSAVAYLTRRDEVNSERIGVLGIDLSGDLAIRSAGTDQQIAAVLALSPFLNPDNTKPGLSILKETTYLGAIRWARPLRLHRKRGELVAELAALDYVSKLASRSLLLVYGEQDGITPADGARVALGEEMARGRLKSLPGEGHLSLPHSPATSALAARWFKENL
jgi:pimeloyl-ACP methyl ester carboxylesterase